MGCCHAWLAFEVAKKHLQASFLTFCKSSHQRSALCSPCFSVKAQRKTSWNNSTRGAFLDQEVQEARKAAGLQEKCLVERKEENTLTTFSHFTTICWARNFTLTEILKCSENEAKKYGGAPLVVLHFTASTRNWAFSVADPFLCGTLF